MKDKNNNVVLDEVELTDDQLSQVVGGINLEKELKHDFKTELLSKAGCKSCGSLHVTKEFVRRSYITYTCQECGYSWNERAI